MSLAILCPGQGGQTSTMFEPIAGNLLAQSVLETAQEVLKESPLDMAGRGADIFINRNAQPLVCTATLARWQALRAHLPRPGIVLGYSVGELAAHAIAGTLTIEDCLHLSARRAECMDNACPPGSGMTAILGLNQKQVEELCAQHDAVIAIVNGETHFVVGGCLINLETFELEAENFGARTSRINISVPSHTYWLKTASDAFAEELSRADLHKPSLPVIAGIDGRLIYDPVEAAHTLAVQISQTLQWQRCVTHAVERGASVMLELGPGCSLVKLVRELYPEVEARSVDEFRSLQAVVSWVEKA